MQRLVVAAALWLAACSEDPSKLDWRFEWEDNADRDRAVAVDVSLTLGGCEGDETIYAARVGRGDGEADAPPALGPGRYGFHGVAVNASCVEIAAGCVEIELPAGAMPDLVVPLAGIDGEARCDPSVCIVGECARLDAGEDGGIDGGEDGGEDAAMDGPDDASREDSGDDASDAAHDAPDDATMDAPEMDATIDAPADAPGMDTAPDVPEMDAMPDVPIDTGPPPCTVLPCATWTADLYLKASNTGDSDWFGESVAISDDGSTVAIGAMLEDSEGVGTTSSGGDDRKPDSGAVYVYRRSGDAWTLDALVKASNTGVGDHFGASVALSGDGNVLAVGAPLEDSSGIGVGGADNNLRGDSGAVYVFARTTTWAQVAYVKAINTGGSDWFGTSVALSYDGSTLAVGAKLEDSNWLATPVFDNNSQPDAGAVYVYRGSAGAYSFDALVKARNAGVGDRFGSSVALSDDGLTLVVGAPFEDTNANGVDPSPDDGSPESGAVYVYTRSLTWIQRAFLKAFNHDVGDRFGERVAISGSASLIAIGAPFEDSPSSTIDGSEADGRDDSGAVYLYAASGSTWTRAALVKAPGSDNNDHFGHSLDLSSDGTVLVVGAPEEDGNGRGVTGDPTNDSLASSGALYVFRALSSAWGFEVYLKATQPDAVDELGQDVAVANDGASVVGCAHFEDGSGTGTTGDATNDSRTNSGACYLFNATP